MLVVRVRRFRCVACGAVVTVTPAETLTRRLYSAAAIAWSLALFGLTLLSTSAIRRRVSPLRIVGPTSAARWVTVLRWCRAIEAGRLFRGARRAAPGSGARAIAEAAAASIAAHALPSPEPPPLLVLAFLGAARAA